MPTVKPRMSGPSGYGARFSVIARNSVKTATSGWVAHPRCQGSDSPGPVTNLATGPLATQSWDMPPSGESAGAARLGIGGAHGVTVPPGPGPGPRGEERLGFKAADALHVAAAEDAQVDVLLTCDDRFCRTARRNAKHLRTRVRNPLNWLDEVEHAVDPGQNLPAGGWKRCANDSAGPGWSASCNSSRPGKAITRRSGASGWTGSRWTTTAN